MRVAIRVCLLLICGLAPLATAVPAMVLDFEPGADAPTVWVVNIPNSNASVTLSREEPHDGGQCLRLHYHFVDTGQFQYLGIPNKVSVQGQIRMLRYWLKGDGSRCSYGVQISDSSGETHQYSKNTGQCGIIAFTGWKQVAVDLASGHETWGGDKNGRLDYPLTGIALTVGQPTDSGKPLPVESDLCFDSLSVDSEETFRPQVSVISPEYGANVKSDTAITLAAPGFTILTIKCWQQGEGLGRDSTVAAVPLDAQGNGSFTFPADQYPHGPVTVRISGISGFSQDTCYLQLYNQGGVSWNEGLPINPPPATQGMAMVFADDFNEPLSISSTDPQARYYDHKPPNGWQDFSVHTFTSHSSRTSPFTQIDSYLRIRASDKTHSSGLISSIKNDGNGITASAPCYFECRFLAPNATGTWPAFWLMTNYMINYQVLRDKTPCDELDIIEAYGGEGPGSPNAGDSYRVTPHCWNQGDQGKALEKTAYDGLHNPIHMRRFGIPSTWFETFHVYGCKITETDTIYYCDNIEVGRHTTTPLSKEQPLFFMVNLATGGGWPVDLSRYGGLADMYVDYIRVYQQRN